MTNSLAIFEGYQIRRHYDEKAETWYFSVVDTVAALTDSVNARDYWFKMKIRVKIEGGIELSTICRQLKMKAPDGKMRLTDCANVEGLLRIIQSIPSPKAEPFKLWLAKVGYERMQEMARPGKDAGQGAGKLAKAREKPKMDTAADDGGGFMKNDKKQKSEILLYTTPDGNQRIEVRLENETVWLSQMAMVELFQTTKQNISLHLKNIFDEDELDINRVVKEYLTTAAENRQGIGWKII